MWSLSCDNPEAIARLYDSVVGLDRVELHELILHRDGPRLQLRFDLPRFPDHPPSRWQAGANTVQVTLDLWIIEDFLLEGWATSNVGEFALTPSPEGIQVSFRTTSARLSARCVAARIVKVSEYSAGEGEGDAAPAA
jgi:hypothetical protein